MVNNPAIFAVGDMVQPKPEWAGDPNEIPTGKIVKIEGRGNNQAIYVEGERRAFAGYVFDRANAEPAATDLAGMPLFNQGGEGR